MSRRLLSTHCRVSSVIDNNPYQPTTCTHPSAAHQSKHRNGYHSGGGIVATTIDTCLSDNSQSYYNYQCCHKKEKCVTSDSDSGSTRVPTVHYENDDDVCRRLSKKSREKINPSVHKDIRRIYPQHEIEVGVYQEIPTPNICESTPPKHLPTSHVSDRPQSSMSSGVTSAIVDGCGGKCQTFENVCYFILQLIFMMGILIGASLCIAGLVLRKSAARNLQVLVYIGILLAIVCAVLFGIQWNARNTAKRRKLAVRNAKRTPIPLEMLNTRNQQQPLMAIQDGQRIVTQIMRPLPHQPDQQGIPWWRRKDLN